MWRKPDIISDAIWGIVNESTETFTNQLIDEEYLLSKGVTDFSKYQVVQGSEPPKLLDLLIESKCVINCIFLFKYIINEQDKEKCRKLFRYFKKKY